MKFRNIYFLLLLAATFAISSCDDDELTAGSGTNVTSSAEKTEFDTWLEENYRKPYNIDFKYNYSDKESDLSYNVIPAELEKSKALAILVKHVWIDAYAEAVSQDFMKTYVPRIIQLTGSYKWNSNGSQVLGTAEGGLKVMLYGVNELDVDNPRINTTNPYESHQVKPIDMNYWFFHTMHHEFCHILTQKKDYDPQFRIISEGKFHATDWINKTDEEVAPEGFVTAYASGEYNEDFAELYATYITNSPEGWEKVLQQSRVQTGEKVKLDENGKVVYKLDGNGERIKRSVLDENGNELYVLNPKTNQYEPAFEYVEEMEPVYDETGTNVLLTKLDMIKEYFRTSWNIELDSLREVVLRRSAESMTLDLRTLK